MNTINKNNSMSNFTPPHVAFRNIGCSQQSCNGSDGAPHCACRLFLCLLVILFAGAVVFAGYRKGLPSSEPHPQPVHVSRALYHNPDSLAHYAELAYLHEDPQGLYVTGAAAFLRDSDPDFPDSCTTVSLDEAAILLLRAAELGHEDALTLIRCLQSKGVWEDRVTEK